MNTALSSIGKSGRSSPIAATSEIDNVEQLFQPLEVGDLVLRPRTIRSDRMPSSVQRTVTAGLDLPEITATWIPSLRSRRMARPSRTEKTLRSSPLPE